MKRERMEELRKIKTGFDFVMGLTPDLAEGRRAGLTDDQTEIVVNYVYQALSRNLLALIDSALAEPSDADVAEAIEWTEQRKTLLGKAIGHMSFENLHAVSIVYDSIQDMQDELAVQKTIRSTLRQYQKPTDEAVRVAIDWLEIEKESAQNSWERAGAEWRIEPGTQEMHDEQMAAFDLAIQALCQMRTEQVTNVMQDSLQDERDV